MRITVIFVSPVDELYKKQYAINNEQGFLFQTEREIDPQHEAITVYQVHVPTVYSFE